MQLDQEQKTRVWKKIILNEEFTENQEYITPNPVNEGVTTPKHTEYQNDVEIECLHPLECLSTFKCRDIKFISLQVCVWPMSNPQFIDFHNWIRLKIKI